MKIHFLIALGMLAGLSGAPLPALAATPAVDPVALFLTLDGDEGPATYRESTPIRVLLTMKNTTPGEVLVFEGVDCQFEYSIKSSKGKVIEKKKFCEQEYKYLRLKRETHSESYQITPKKKLKAGDYTVEVAVTGHGSVATDFTVLSKKQKKTNDTKVKAQIESAAFVTTGGVAVIQQPKGWVGNVLIDKKPEAYVFFTNPEKTINLQVGVGATVKGADSEPLAQIERTARMYGTGTFTGNSVIAKVIRQRSVTIGKAKGYEVEISRKENGVEYRIKELVVAKSGKYYSVAVKVTEADWNKYRSVIEASAATLRIQ